MKLILTLVDWAALGVIVAASAWQNPLAERFIGAAAVWAGVFNAFALLILSGLIFSSNFRAKYQEQQAKRGWLDKAFGLLNQMVGLAVFAYAGWLATFGIRLVFLLISKLAAQREKDAA